MRAAPWCCSPAGRTPPSASPGRCSASPMSRPSASSYGQRHAVELECRANVIAAAAHAVPEVGQAAGEDHLLDLSLLGQISDTALTDERAIEMNEDGLPNTFVPGRNLLFLTFAGTVAYRRGLNVLVGGMCETDFSGYPDCRDNTLKALQVAISLGLDAPMTIETPLMWFDKAQTWAPHRSDWAARRWSSWWPSTPTPATWATARGATSGATAAACARPATCAVTATTPGCIPDGRVAPGGASGMMRVPKACHRVAPHEPLDPLAGHRRRRPAVLVRGRLQPAGRPARRHRARLRAGGRAVPLPPRAACCGRPKPSRAPTPRRRRRCAPPAPQALAACDHARAASWGRRGDHQPATGRGDPGRDPRADPVATAGAEAAALAAEAGRQRHHPGLRRRQFNERCQRYNSAVGQFPTWLLAGLFRFRPARHTLGRGPAADPETECKSNPAPSSAQPEQRRARSAAAAGPRSRRGRHEGRAARAADRPDQPARVRAWREETARVAEAEQIRIDTESWVAPAACPGSNCCWPGWAACR